MTLQLELTHGRSNDATRLLDAPGTFVVGSSVRSDWRVVARGVRPNHFVLSWDGVALVVQSICEPGAVEVDDRVVTTPFAITGMAHVRFGDAVVRVFRIPVRDDTPTLIASLGTDSSNADSSDHDALDDDGSDDVTRVMPVIRPPRVAPPALPVTRKEGVRAKPPSLPEPRDERAASTPPPTIEASDPGTRGARISSEVREDGAPAPSSSVDTCREGVTPASHGLAVGEIPDVEPESVGRWESLREIARAFAARPAWAVGAAAVAAVTFVASACAVHAHRASVSHAAAARVAANAVAVADVSTARVRIATQKTPLTVPTGPQAAEQSAPLTTTPTPVVAKAPETSAVSPDIAAKLLAAGEHDDAARAYAELAKRYPDEPVYRVIASALSSVSPIATRAQGTER